MSSRQGWETAEFPILCESCLGDNPYVRMQKQPFGKECKTCGRPFTIFKWCPGAGCRLKKTEICQTCAKIKNVCQTCVLDLQYGTLQLLLIFQGLPVQVRDTILNLKDTVPNTDVNRQFFVASVDAQLRENPSESLVDYSRADSAAKELLRKMSRKDPSASKNNPHVCSFFVKGTCNRGDECPYRHEQPLPQSDLSRQNIKDRFAGQNDPVAGKLLKKTLKAPEDKSITTLFIAGIDEDINELDIRSHFETFGDIKHVNMLYKAKGAFAVFATRESAEEAANVCSASFNIKGKPLRIQWGKSKGKAQFRSGARPNSLKKQEQLELEESAVRQPEMSKLDRVLSLGAGPAPPGASSTFYPSMNPYSRD